MMSVQTEQENPTEAQAAGTTTVPEVQTDAPEETLTAQVAEEAKPELVISPIATPAKGKKKGKEASRYTKKRKWKKWVVLGVIAIIVGGWLYYKAKLAPPVLPIALTTPLVKGDISNVVGLDGVVHSAQDAQVYASASGMVEKVTVQVGDRVEAGQILAQLDTDDLQMQITEQQARINLGAKKNEFAQESAEKALTDGKVDVAAGLNSSLLSADARLNSAQQELNAARNAYGDAKDDRELGDYEMDVARRDLDRKNDKLIKERTDREKAQATGSWTPEQEDQYLKVEKEYLDAFEKYNELYVRYEDDLSAEGKRLRQARVDYQEAVDSRNATKNAVDRSIEELERSIQSTELSSDMTLERLSLQRLTKQLGDSTVTAPISGTITAVYAKEGAPASGMLFLIEDTENMVIKTAVKEYDVNVVKEGMAVTVKSDATGEEEYAGKVEKIYPTSAKDEKGDAAAKVQFETDVALTTEETGLRVGMNVRLGVTTAEKKDVFSVPFDAVITNAEGKDIIYIAEKNAEGKTIVRSIPVSLGLETDFALEISGEGLSDGMLVLTEPSGVTEGMEIADPTMAGTPMAGGATAGGGAAMMVAG